MKLITKNSISGAYAGTGNVLKIQHLLHICSEHYEPFTAESSSSDKDKSKDKEPKDKEEKEKDLSQCQAVAVLGIALIALGEDIGSEMAFRSFGNLVSFSTFNFDIEKSI